MDEIETIIKKSDKPKKAPKVKEMIKAGGGGKTKSTKKLKPEEKVDK
jgi:hypothetical protein